MILLIVNVDMMLFETFFINDNLVGSVISNIVLGSKGIVWLKFKINILLFSTGAKVKLLEESTGLRPEQHFLFKSFSIVVFDEFFN